MKAKNLISLLLAGSMVLGLTACAPTTNTDGEQPSGGETPSGETVSSDYLVWNIGTEPKTWDPQLNTASDGGHVILNLYDGLVRDTQEGIKMASAESYDLSANAEGVEDTVYTFHLRDDIYWSDGQPVTPATLSLPGSGPAPPRWPLPTLSWSPTTSRAPMSISVARAAGTTWLSRPWTTRPCRWS